MKNERYMVTRGNQSVFIVRICIILSILTILPGKALCQYGGGSGTKANPYQIKTAAHLLAISDNSDDFSSYFILVNDISILSVANSLEPIGSSTNVFQGYFNGNGKSISGFNYSRGLNEGEYNDFGLFGYIGSGGLVENLWIENGDVSMYNKGYIAFIAARNSGTIRNCHVSGAINAGWVLGGIVGENVEAGSIIDCSATNMDIYGGSNAIGGIAGINRGLISKSYVETAPGGYIESYTNNAGGIAGYNGDNGSIINCYAIANVQVRTTQAGGITGYCSSLANVKYCYAVGTQTFSATGSNQVRGGIVARNSGTIVSCIWDNTVSESTAGVGLNNGGTVTNVLGYSTIEMQDEENYTDIGWDFTAVWTINSGDYPILASLPDLTITYDSHHDDVLNNEIVIPVTLSNISSFDNSNTISVNIYTSTTADADWDEIADENDPYMIFTDEDINDLAAGDSESVDIELPAKSDVGVYYYCMKVSVDEESDTSNNWGPELEVEVFEAQAWEDDDSISDVTGQGASFPRTAAIYPETDIDWIELVIADTSDVTLTLTNSYETNLVMELYNADGTEADVSPNEAEGEGSAELSVLLSAATYYLKIYQPDDEVVMQYSLAAEIDKILPDVAVELNSLDTIYILQNSTNTIDINFTMVNNSVISSGTYSYQLVSAATDTIDLSDPDSYTAVEGRNGRISLVGEEEYSELFSFQPVTADLGDRYYAVIVDSEDELSESNENNNLSSSVRVHTYELDSYEPDDAMEDAKELIFGTKSTYSIEPVADVDYMYFEVTDKSKVTVEITCNSLIKLGLYRTDDVYDPEATETLYFDNSTTGTNKYTWDVILEKDTYYLKVNEPGNDMEIPEYTITVKSVLDAPDLTCKMAKKYLSSEAGITSFKATILVSNKGTAAVTGVNAKLKIASSIDANWSTAEVIATSLDSTLSIAKYTDDASGTFTIEIPESDGIYYMKAFVDAVELIDESDEDNNASPTIILAVGEDYGYSGGSGTSSSPWQISTAFDLDMISEISTQMEDYFVLTHDIDLSTLEGEYNSIGTSSVPFIGNFNGQGYTISNYVINSSGDATGIFGYTDKSDTISSEIIDLNLTGVDIISDSYDGACGGLVGTNGCNIYYCTVSGTIDTDGVAGMLAGSNLTNSMILYSYVSQTTLNSSGSGVGMIVGENAGVIMNCYTDQGVVSGEGDIGGLCGINDGSIYDSYSRATVMATSDNAGGFIGTNNGVIGYCYSTGSMSVPTDIIYGGFSGLNSGSMTSCFWSLSESGVSTDNSLGIGVTGLTASEMLDKSIFESAGWVFGNAPYSSWLMADGYIQPKLLMLYYFGGGEGTLETPYLLSSYVDFLLAGDLPGLHYKLSADIDLTGMEFEKPLFGHDVDNPFTGTFNGDGHSISNYTMSGVRGIAGIFGYIVDVDSEDDYTAGVSNLAVYSPTIQTLLGSEFTGVIAGEIYAGELKNCAVRDAYVIGSDFVGGLAGTLNYGSISNSCFNGEVIGVEYVGGLAGGWQLSDITNCYSNAKVSAYDNFGGLTGYSLFTSPERSYYGPNPNAVNWGENISSDAEFWYDSETGWDMIGETENGSEDLWQVVDGYGYPWLSYENVVIEGDLDNDEKVDLADFGILAENWLNGYEMEDVQTMSENWMLEIYNK